VRRYEAEYVNGLWHWDCHHGSRKVITSRGEWVTPILFGVLDDRSRLACHLQWYLAETAEVIAHGLSQAFQKRGLPRAALSDNGSAMTAAEIAEGLARLGVLHHTTLPYSPYQNAKQEAFWGPVEGRLIAMLEHVPDLTVAFLDLLRVCRTRVFITIPWVARTAIHGAVATGPHVEGHIFEFDGATWARLFTPLPCRVVARERIEVFPEPANPVTRWWLSRWMYSGYFPRLQYYELEPMRPVR